MEFLVDRWIKKGKQKLGFLCLGNLIQVLKLKSLQGPRMIGKEESKRDDTVLTCIIWVSAGDRANMNTHTLSKGTQVGKITTPEYARENL